MASVISVGIPSRSRWGRRVRGWAGATVVVLAVVVLMVLLIPRPNAVIRPIADVTAAAEDARTQLGFYPSVPRDLPEGWVPVQAQVKRDSGGTPTWHVGYIAANGDFVGFVQAVNPPLVWENTQVISGPETGTVTVGSHDWVVRNREDRGVTSYVLRTAPVETIVSGSTDAAVVETLIRSLDLPTAGGMTAS